MISYGNLGKNKPPSKSHMQRHHYIVERALNVEPLSSWEPSINGWLYLEQYAHSPLKMGQNWAFRIRHDLLKVVLSVLLHGTSRGGMGALLMMAGSLLCLLLPGTFQLPWPVFTLLSFPPLKLENTASSITDTFEFQKDWEWIHFFPPLTSEKDSAGKSEWGGKEGGGQAKTKGCWCSQSHSKQLGSLQGAGHSCRDNVLPCTS